MADYDLALGIKPPQIDVATPLLTAAKIRASDLEAQKHAMEMQFLPAFQQAQLRQLGLSSQKTQQDIDQSPLKLAADLRQKNVTSQTAEEELRSAQVGQVLRGIAPYANKPEFQTKADEAHQELLDRKLITPEQYAAYKNGGPYSPLTLQGALARTETAEQALKERTQRLAELSPVTIGSNLSGEIRAVRDPNTGNYHVIDNKGNISPTPIPAQNVPTTPPASLTPVSTPAAPQPGGPQPGGPQPGSPVPTPQSGGPQPDLPQPAEPILSGETAKPVVPPGATAPTPAPPKKLSAADVAGQKYLDENFDKNEHQTIKDVAEYRRNPQSFSARKGGSRDKVLEAAANYAAARGEVYDQRNYASSQEALKQFGPGKKPGDAVRAFNVGLEHIDQLLELGRKLENGTFQPKNEFKNWFKTKFGEDAPTNFNGLKAIVGAEIVKAIVGSGGTGEERAQAAKTVSAASSMKQLEGIANTYKGAMGAQLGGLKRQYEEGVLRKDFERLLSPAAAKSLAAHEAATAAPGTERKTQSGIPWSVE